MSAADQRDVGEPVVTKRGWQFSLFGLLVVVTIVSVCLAFGVYYPRVLLAMLAIGLVQLAALYMVEWLMRRRGGRTVKQVTAIVRAILGTALILSAWGLMQVPYIANVNSTLPLLLAYLMGSVGLLCWIFAWRHWS